MNGDQFELEITKFYQKNEDEESYDMAVSSDEKLSFTITSGLRLHSLFMMHKLKTLESLKAQEQTYSLKNPSIFMVNKLAIPLLPPKSSSCKSIR